MEKNKLPSLSKQITLKIIVITSVVLIIALTSTHFFMKRVMLENARNTIGYLLNENKHQIENQLNRVQTNAEDIISMISINSDDNALIFSFIENLLETNPALEAITVARNPEPSLRMSHSFFRISQDVHITDLSNTTYNYQDWYQIPLLGMREHWSEPWFDQIASRKIVTSLSKPVMINGEFWGVIRLDLALSFLQRIASSISLKQTGYAILLSNKGTIITHPDESLLMNESIFSLAESYEDNQLRVIGKDMLAGNTSFIKLKGSPTFANKWMYYSPLISNSWSMAIIIDDNDLFSELNDLLLIQSLIIIFAFAVLTATINIYMVQIYKPLISLTKATQRIADGDFDTALDLSPRILELDQLTNSFNKMKSSINQYIKNLNEEKEAKQKIQTEMHIAAQIQKNLIPANDNPLNQSTCFKAFGIIEAAREVGGDFYDYFLLDETRLCFAIADVMGNGLAAALNMTVVSTLLNTSARLLSTPPQILKSINDYICEHITGSGFVTMILGILDLESGRLVFSNAGHVPLYIRRAGRKFDKYAETSSTALGIFPDINIKIETVDLFPGDEIILFTDGITEAMSQSQVFFGLHRLENILLQQDKTNPEITAKAILEGVRQFSSIDSNPDDLTIFVISFFHPKRSANPEELISS